MLTASQEEEKGCFSDDVEGKKKIDECVKIWKVS